MVPELEKPRVTEIQVRMDCNGCVQKIKKALHGINGIYDIYIDIPQQKLTIIGWADPEKIVKAIKKTRKAATICTNMEAAPPTEPTPEGGAPPPDPANPPPAEAAPSAEPAAAAEPPKETPPPPSSDNPPSEGTQAPGQGQGQGQVPAQTAMDSTASQPPQTSGHKDVEEVQVVYHHPPDHGYRYGYNQNVRVYTGHVEHYPSPSGPGLRHEPPQPIHVNHSYNTYKPTPYVTEYEYIRPPPQYTRYSRPEPPQEYTRYSKPEPPQEYTCYSRPEPPQEYTYYSRPEPPQEYTQYNRSEPPQHYTYYSRPQPPPQYYIHYNQPEPPPQFTHYSRQEPPQYIHYNGDYHSSSNGNGNITSIFSDENPNACRIA